MPFRFVIGHISHPCSILLLTCGINLHTKLQRHIFSSEEGTRDHNLNFPALFAVPFINSQIIINIQTFLIFPMQQLHTSNLQTLHVLSSLSFQTLGIGSNLLCFGFIPFSVITLPHIPNLAKPQCSYLGLKYKSITSNPHLKIVVAYRVLIIPNLLLSWPVKVSTTKAKAPSCMPIYFVLLLSTCPFKLPAKITFTINKN